MSKYCMIETAFNKKEELEEAIKILLKEKLVSSCQVIESNSKWNWKNEYEESKEYLVFMKTKKSLQEEVYNTIKRIHSYACNTAVHINIADIEIFDISTAVTPCFDADSAICISENAVFYSNISHSARHFTAKDNTAMTMYHSTVRYLNIFTGEFFLQKVIFGT